MISFIVIGRNEGWKLKKCFDSILTFTEANNLKDYEIIYVDSKSTDNSIEIAKSFMCIRIFIIKGECNPAIARNIGAREANGDILFFIDGDMEISSAFYNFAFDDNGKLVYPFLTGVVIDYNYNSKWEAIDNNRLRRNLSKDKYDYFTGGIFLIEKKLWDYVGGMKTKYAINEDIEFGLRLSKQGYKMLTKKEIIAVHHTIPYYYNYRSWNMLLTGKDLYPVVLLRDHFLNINVWKKFLSENYTILLLLFAFLFYLSLKEIYFFGIYLIVVLIKSFHIINNLTYNLIFFSIKLILRDILRFLAFFFFWPKCKKIEYEKVIL